MIIYTAVTLQYIMANNPEEYNRIMSIGGVVKKTKNGLEYIILNQ